MTGMAATADVKEIVVDALPNMILQKTRKAP
jgi:hypothetical protein